MDKIILIIIIASCVIFITVCLIRKRPDLLVNFALRASLGTAGVYVLDIFLKSRGYGVFVGVNAMSVLSNGLLGLPGFILLYGLAAFYSFR